MNTFFQRMPPLQTRVKVIDDYIDPGLNMSDYAFVQSRATKVGLRPAYLGPYRIAKRFDHHFDLEMAGKIKSIAIDHLKAAKLPCSREYAPENHGKICVCRDQTRAHADQTETATPPNHENRENNGSDHSQPETLQTKTGRAVRTPKYLDSYDLSALFSYL